MAMQRYAAGPSPSGLVDVLDLILDKGLVIDLYVRVSLVGIELLTIDARIVVASVDTYLRFAEAVNRLDLEEKGDQKGLPDIFSDDEEDDERDDEDADEEEERRPRRRRQAAARRSSSDGSRRRRRPRAAS